MTYEEKGKQLPLGVMLRRMARQEIEAFFIEYGFWGGIVRLLAILAVVLAIAAFAVLVIASPYIVEGSLR